MSADGFQEFQDLNKYEAQAGDVQEN